ncbi:hypothetical protein DPMN_050453 [Dreissena polymorpha]|uniref:Uncharacterized protein n=1 Tax=Dreissena polymorpha TaxID=45954 RepID=A0A9D4HN10_DREPO|nr:hypothetical protein DPMN_050453 [Dreissena polymorpha]
MNRLYGLRTSTVMKTLTTPMKSPCKDLNAIERYQRITESTNDATHTGAKVRPMMIDHFKYKINCARSDGNDIINPDTGAFNSTKFIRGFNETLNINSDYNGSLYDSVL